MNLSGGLNQDEIRLVANGSMSKKLTTIRNARFSLVTSMIAYGGLISGLLSRRFGVGSEETGRFERTTSLFVISLKELPP
ncbi:MAG: hypothetical protein AAF696_38965 [Bacteroidota bacterium]